MCGPKGECPLGLTCSALQTCEDAPDETADAGVQQGYCGDGIVNGIEACDGANLGGKTCVDFGSTDTAGLVCTSDCSFDKSGCNGYCGDGHKGTEEQCDGDDFGGKTCTDFSPPGTTHKFYAGGAPRCTIDCMANVLSCTGGWCGDGVKQSIEDCDGSDFGQPPATCMSLGHPGAATMPACDSTTCSFTADTCSCGLNGICPAATPTCVNNGGTYSCQ